MFHINHNLNGKIALVTGASKGLGKYISAALADSGANVIVNFAHSQEAAQQTVDFIRSNGGNAIAVHFLTI